ncbi:MAG TPA: class I SAM-dependent methyltransferase, partial [Thiotrichales bacterium]|nr:class I SAM-dependent methyltransferase [Thiotrichales bacterium]
MMRKKTSVVQDSVERGYSCPTATLAVASSTHQKRKSLFGLGLLSSRVTRLDRWLTRRMLEVVGKPPVQISLWDGAVATPPCDRPVARLVYHDRGALIKTILDPERHWGDLYCSGRVTFSGDMVAFMEAIYLGISGQQKKSWLRRFVLWLGHRRIFNPHDKARENVHHHYDIGNAFYRLWLDREAMQYTCAYYYQPTLTLEQAQLAKLHHLCRKLQLKPGDTVVEAGCGWGGLALFMAKHYGVSVRAYNISREQILYARQRAADEGLAERVDYILDDYRNIRGEFDVFVSVGMLEHVGVADYRVLGEVIQRCLKKDGRGLVHSIGKVVKAPMNPWIERRIFPGAYAPTLSEMMQIFEPNNLAVQDVENLRLHYSKTLACWLQRFNQHRDAITGMMD